MKTPNLTRVPKVVQLYIHDLEASVVDDAQQILDLTQCIERLEEQYRLLHAERFAPKSRYTPSDTSPLRLSATESNGWHNVRNFSFDCRNV